MPNIELEFDELFDEELDQENTKANEANDMPPKQKPIPYANDNYRDYYNSFTDNRPYSLNYAY